MHIRRRKSFKSTILLTQRSLLRFPAICTRWNPQLYPVVPHTMVLRRLCGITLDNTSVRVKVPFPFCNYCTSEFSKKQPVGIGHAKSCLVRPLKLQESLIQREEKLAQRNTCTQFILQNRACEVVATCKSARIIYHKDTECRYLWYASYFLCVSYLLPQHRYGVLNVRRNRSHDFPVSSKRWMRKGSQK